jgi:hypothetical protein
MFHILGKSGTNGVLTCEIGNGSLIQLREALQFKRKALADYLQHLGVPVMQLSFPGRREGSMGNLVYQVHHDPKRFGVREVTPLALQALHIAVHLDEIT